jgi:hypothetical protein
VEPIGIHLCNVRIGSSITSWCSLSSKSSGSCLLFVDELRGGGWMVLLFCTQLTTATSHHHIHTQRVGESRWMTPNLNLCVDGILLCWKTLKSVLKMK